MRTSVNEISCCCCCCLSVFPVLLTMSSTVMHVLGPGMSSRTLKAGVGVPSFKFFVYANSLKHKIVRLRSWYSKHIFSGAHQYLDLT